MNILNHYKKKFLNFLNSHMVVLASSKIYLVVMKCTYMYIYTNIRAYLQKTKEAMSKVMSKLVVRAHSK